MTASNLILIRHWIYTWFLLQNDTISIPNNGLSNTEKNDSVIKNEMIPDSDKRSAKTKQSGEKD